MIIAQFVKEELELDKVIFIPAAHPPHKRVFAPSHLRLEMVWRAIAGNPAFECSEIEINQEDISYSVDTIARLKEEYQLPREELFWIIGSDNFIDFASWKEPSRIVSLCQTIVFPRNNVDFESGPDTFKREAMYLKDAPIVAISSTLIRSFVAQSRSISYLVPPAVEQLITSNNLYR